MLFIITTCAVYSTEPRPHVYNTQNILRSEIMNTFLMNRKWQLKEGKNILTITACVRSSHRCRSVLHNKTQQPLGVTSMCGQHLYFLENGKKKLWLNWMHMRCSSYRETVQESDHRVGVVIAKNIENQNNQTDFFLE